MWKEYINQISLLQYNNTQEYCSAFAQYFLGKPVSLLKETEDCLFSQRHNNFTFEDGHTLDLFPETNKTTLYFNSGYLEYVISIVYHFFDIKWDNFFWSGNINVSLATEEKYKLLFNENNSDFLYKKITFLPEDLLSIDNNHNTLTFLFLYFLPCTMNNSLLFHYKKNIPLVTINKISYNHFNMLLYLMRRFEEQEFLLLCEGYNLNHLLIEDYMDNATELLSFKDNIDWEELLPMKKIHTLLRFNCHFNSFADFRNQKHLFTFEQLPEILIYLQHKFYYTELEKALPTSQSKLTHKTKV